MKQYSFTDSELNLRKKKTKKEEFLVIMDNAIPWEEWTSCFEPHYPSGKRGRPPLGIETMLRMYLLQCWYNLSDEGIEDEIYDSIAFRSFMKINFAVEQAPDSTTLLKFRHLLEDNGIGKLFFDAIARELGIRGRTLRSGTVVDATLISAPTSTKNVANERDPEMHQTKKGKNWQFGMKCHIGVDAETGLVHSLETSSANVHDLVVAPHLALEEDEVVFAVRAIWELKIVKR
jgi:IS5 family transposase